MLFTLKLLIKIKKEVISFYRTILVLNKMKRNTNIRSMLFIPGHKKNFISTIDSIKSDCIVFDLEDSVPASKKKQARKNLKDLKKNNFIQKEFLCEN